MGKLTIKRLRDFPKTTKLVSDMTSYPVVLFSSPFLSHHTLIKDLIKKKKSDCHMNSTDINVLDFRRGRNYNGM